MNNTNETVADIVRAMRNPPEDGTPGYYSDYESDTCYESLKLWADRIEAAAERDAAIHAMTCEANERLREHLKIALEGKPGNNAAMREALERLLRQMQWEYAQEGDAAVMDRGYIADNIDIAVSALAAPARNCDRFRTLADFSMADSPIDTPLTNATREQLYKVIRWLFAKAEGKEVRDGNGKD